MIADNGLKGYNRKGQSNIISFFRTNVRCITIIFVKTPFKSGSSFQTHSHLKSWNSANTRQSDIEKTSQAAGSPGFCDIDYTFIFHRVSYLHHFRDSFPFSVRFLTPRSLIFYTLSNEDFKLPVTFENVKYFQKINSKIQTASK